MRTDIIALPSLMTIREHLGISRRKLAAYANNEITESMIYRIEVQHSQVSRAKAYMLVNGLNVRIEALKPKRKLVDLADLAQIPEEEQQKREEEEEERVLREGTFVEDDGRGWQ